MTFDIGSNLTGLALLYFFLRYALPLIAGAILLVFLYAWFRSVRSRLDHTSIGGLMVAAFIVLLAVLLFVVNS